MRTLYAHNQYLAGVFHNAARRYGVDIEDLEQDVEIEMFKFNETRGVPEGAYRNRAIEICAKRLKYGAQEVMIGFQSLHFESSEDGDEGFYDTDTSLTCDTSEYDDSLDDEETIELAIDRANLCDRDREIASNILAFGWDTDQIAAHVGVSQRQGRNIANRIAERVAA